MECQVLLSFDTDKACLISSSASGVRKAKSYTQSKESPV